MSLSYFAKGCCKSDYTLSSGNEEDRQLLDPAGGYDWLFSIH
jgi:hypothetical protein